MIIHLGGGIRASGEDLPYFRNIVDIIQQHGDIVARNWIELSHHSADVKNVKDDQVVWRETFKQNEDALNRADIFIAEVSTYRLYSGYELAVALQQHKPILLVSRKSFKQFAISGIDNKLLTMKEYSTESELTKIVKSFLEVNSIPPSDKEVSISLDLRLYSYLREASKNTDKTDGELLRDLARRGLEK